jgi:type II secretory pathway predicted ATPase ExeA
MYKKFFGLTRNPFEISPDPYFYYGSPRHNEALAAIYYAIRARKGFVVVTGEVGTGKSLLIRRVLEDLDRKSVAVAYVFNTRLDPEEFLHYIMGDLNLPPAKSKSQALLQLNDFLIARYRKDLTTALIVDEAQNLGRDVLEEIRLLTNLETTTQKLLQIVLVGQPELDLKLDSMELRQLKQRVAFRCHLAPLTPLECRDYIVRRLQRAGAQANAWKIFPDPVILRIYHYSRGIPRLINTICESALISAYARQTPNVGEDLIEEAATDLRLNVVPQPPPKWGGNGAEKRALLRRVLDLLEAINDSEDQATPLTGESAPRIGSKPKASP